MRQSALSAFTPSSFWLWKNHCRSRWNTFFYLTQDCSLRQFHATSLSNGLFLNHVVQGRFVFLLLSRSLPASLTFSSSFASFCLPIATPSTSCSVYTLWEELFQAASSFGKGFCRFHWNKASFFSAQKCEQVSSVFEFLILTPWVF